MRTLGLTAIALLALGVAGCGVASSGGSTLAGSGVAPPSAAVVKTILVIDTDGSALARTQFLDIHPAGVAVSPDGSRVYVAGCKLTCVDGTLLTIDAESGSVESKIALPSAPCGLALAPDGAHAYVPSGRAAALAVVDLACKEVTTIPVDPEPIGVAVNPRSGLVYVTSFGGGSVSVVDPRLGGVIRRLSVARGPRAIAVSPDGRFAYVTHTASICSVLDLQRIAGVSAP